MPAYRLFIEPSGENKGHYKLRVVSLPLSTAISGVALTLSARNYTVDLLVLARALFFFSSLASSARVRPYVLMFQLGVQSECVSLSDSISSHCGRTFRSLALCQGLALTATLRLLLLASCFVCFEPADGRDRIRPRRSSSHVGSKNLKSELWGKLLLSVYQES